MRPAESARPLQVQCQLPRCDGVNYAGGAIVPLAARRCLCRCHPPVALLFEVPVNVIGGTGDSRCPRSQSLSHLRQQQQQLRWAGPRSRRRAPPPPPWRAVASGTSELRLWRRAPALWQAVL